MNASRFVDRYYNLDILADMPGAPFKATVSINKYLIATQSNIAQIRANQSAVFAKAGEQIDHGVRARVQNGKASPDDCETVLVAAVESGALKADERALQQWADTNLGVDCTGFAIAYLVEIGALEWSATLNGGASCPWIYHFIARANWQLTKYADQTEIWKVGDIQQDDLILWMMSGGGPETKSPGHISVVVSADSTGLSCAESNGADDGAGHKGPQNTSRNLGTVKSLGGKKCWQFGAGVIVVRPPSGS